MPVEIPYDELWKDAVENLFPHFINLTVPDFYPDVNWSKPTIFLDDELRQISPASEETKRYVDRLVRVWMLDGGKDGFSFMLKSKDTETLSFQGGCSSIFTASTTNSRGTS